jgi:hypothetical protein
MFYREQPLCPAPSTACPDCDFTPYLKIPLIKSFITEHIYFFIEKIQLGVVHIQGRLQNAKMNIKVPM